VYVNFFARLGNQTWYSILMIEFLLINLVIALAINTVGFAVAFTFKTDKLTDFSYSLTFVTLIIVSLVRSENINTPNMLMAGLVTLWGLRLGSYLVMRIHAWGKDRRFDEIRENFVKFLQFWLGQAVVAWVVLITPMIFMWQNQSESWSLWHFVGLSVFVSALLFEAVADLQLFDFINRKKAGKTKQQFIDEGLWKYSRHPNYFGEISVWFGAWLYTFSALTPSQKLIGAITPLSIFFIIRFVTGIPKLEKSAEEKWGKLKEYKEYEKRTGLLIPKL